MPAVDTISRGAVGPRGPVDTSGLLIETMQIEEPMKSQIVPNHLLETKIYTKIAQNSMVLAKPSVIHFGGFEVDKKHTVSLSIVNVSTEVIRMHIIPPQTKYFYVKYTKNERLVPGLTLECTIEFTPDEWRYYYDCIRINCPNEENLIIPIHAYPVMSTKEFPQLFNFPPVPVGHKMTKMFPLRCEAPIDFEYQLTYLQPHQAFSVYPMSGIIPANGETEVSVTFSPIEFHTAFMRIQLVISQFNSNPIVCTFTGTSVPGLLKDETVTCLEQDYSMMCLDEEDSMLDPRSLTPVERARRKRKTKQISLPPPTNVKQEVDYQGVKFPVQLNNPYAVAQVLNQEPGKMRAKDLRELVVAKNKDSQPTAATRQMKEAKFEHSVRKNVYEERQNQLRWQSKLGDEQIRLHARSKILADRNEAWNIYKISCSFCIFKLTSSNTMIAKSDSRDSQRSNTNKIKRVHDVAQMKSFSKKLKKYKRCGVPVEREEYTRQCTECTFKRTLRDKDNLPSQTAQFDKYTNNMWHVRHKTLDRFCQAARKVIIRQRATKKLGSLRTLIEDWRRKKFSLITECADKLECCRPRGGKFVHCLWLRRILSAEQKEKLNSDEKKELLPSELELRADHVKQHQFPTYVPPNVKDDMAPDALGSVPFVPTDVIVKREEPYFPLKVPLIYELNSYKSYVVQDVSSGYVPVTMTKALRSGAEDEVINLPPAVLPKGKRPPAPGTPTKRGVRSPLKDVTPATTVAAPDTAVVEKPTTSRVVSLTPPASLFQPMDYPPLHIFNPSPGLQVFQAPVPYAETDADFHLCPLPRYYRKDHTTNIHAATQRKYMDTEDVVRGIMAWKKFPSQGLTSLSNTPTLTNVWVPRWDDQFHEEMLPSEVPTLLDSLAPEDDEEIIEEEEDEGRVTSRQQTALDLTPDMVNAQFKLIDSTTPTEERAPLDAFPHGNRMPATNIPVSVCGPVPREKREEELEYFMTKKYNRLGSKINTKVNHLNNYMNDQKFVLK